MTQIQKPVRKTDVEKAQQWFAESEMTHRPDLFQFFPDRKVPSSDVAIPIQEPGIPPPGPPQPPPDDRFPLAPQEMNLPPPDHMPFDPRSFDQDAFKNWLIDQESLRFDEPNQEKYHRDVQWPPQNYKQDANADRDSEDEFDMFPAIPPDQVHRMNQYENRLPPWMRHTQGNYDSQLEEFYEPQIQYQNYMKGRGIDDYKNNKGNFNEKDNGANFEDEKNDIEYEKYLGKNSNFDQLDKRKNNRNENDKSYNFSQRKLMSSEVLYFESGIDLPKKRFPTVLLIGSEESGTGMTGKRDLQQF